MILDKIINVGTNSSCLKHYKNLGYKFKCGEYINISVDNLMLTSHRLINVKCDVCGLEKKLQYRRYLLSLNNGGYYACSKCGLDKYKKTCLEKYGVENAFQNEEIKEKIKLTNIKKFGFDHPLKSEMIKNKMKNTNIEKYGYKNVFQNEEIKEKIKENNLKKYGVEYYTQSVDYKNELNYMSKMKNSIRKRTLEKYSKFNIIDISIEKNLYYLKCERCKSIYEINPNALYMRLNKYNTILCTICNPLNNHVSGQEIQLRDFIKENYDDEVIYNSRKIIKPLELDIYLPNLNLAFEFNGTYWHSNHFKDENYHNNKINKCKNKNINLIHIWEKDWTKGKDEMKSMILKLIRKVNV